MRIFDVTGCRARIVRPGTTLTAWAAANKPFALCNASLYTAALRPIGTVIENGKMVHDDGNGYGFGVIDGKPGFGRPWDAPWDDYLTGYNSPVQCGVYVAPAFRDDYVFGCRLARIGLGRRGTQTLIVTDDGVTLREFAEHAIAAGLDTLVNLDGGGSRHLLHGGVPVYQSPRVPYNAIAFYREDEGEDPSTPARGASAQDDKAGAGAARGDKAGAPCEYCTEDGRCLKWK